MRNLYIVLLLGLFILGYFLCKNNLCDNQSTSAAVVPVAKTSDHCRTQLIFKDTDFQLVSKENFRFNKSSSEMLEPSDQLISDIEQVATYLKDNPERIMQIKGLYAKGEANDSEEKSLGHARAIAVKNILIGYQVEPAQISTIGKLTKSSCYKDEVLQKGISTAFK